MKKLNKILLLTLLLSGCASPDSIKVIRQSDKVQGKTISVTLEHGRLIFYIQRLDKVLLCHAYNESNKNILKEVEDLTNKPGTDVVLYGQTVSGDSEYLTGVDFIVTTIELIDPIKNDKVFIDLNYGDRIKDAFSFRGMLRQSIKTVSDKAISVVKP